MTMAMYLHPLSSYSQKAKTAFYEKGVDFETRMLDGSEPIASAFAALWPIGKFPLLTDGDKMVFEATSIIEYVDNLYPETSRLIPEDQAKAAEVRMWDRFFDNYINYPQQRMVYVAIGREADDGEDCAKWKAAFEAAFGVLDHRLKGREWVAGDTFSLADCAAAPSLLYADWTHPIPKSYKEVWTYRDRLLARPSYARALDEARPYRHMFPLGAPVGRD
ncbi:glutathione S-transferase family protein [Phyllobacterium myrsinacearum]|uniref:Glutathione S-transferase n=1 Tax=Phyllobacterium myrsinacearum TaxID=28101 RepID=A0A839EGJ2_9HYPH|nr:glutathione S-transferase family protein [Phyllobacterium myrsinacearum]MBA8879091.1 glutathione S-transferase [Phyllobacterium myrsinacearum]